MKELELTDLRTKNSTESPKIVESISKTFDQFYEIQKLELVEFVDDEDPNTIVIILIYQPVCFKTKKN